MEAQLPLVTGKMHKNTGEWERGGTGVFAPAEQREQAAVATMRLPWRGAGMINVAKECLPNGRGDAEGTSFLCVARPDSVRDMFSASPHRAEQSNNAKDQNLGSVSSL